MKVTNNNELEKGLYLHVPFCVSKCHYCDFNSWKPASQEETTEYVTLIKKHLGLLQNRDQIDQVIWGSIYLGGGTPTFLSGADLSSLWEVLTDYIQWTEDAEITIEANPGTLTDDKLKVISNYVNRVSLGLQTTHTSLLKVLGRSHGYECFLNTYERLMDNGLQDINVDLIYGIPGQTLEMFLHDLDQVIALRPTHIAVYNLTIEAGTRMADKIAQGALKTADEDIEIGMYYQARERLLEAGYHHYEISNFCLPGYESKHNQVYWKRKPYLGLGPGAHSFWKGKRCSHQTNLTGYSLQLEQGQCFDQVEPLTWREALSEEFFLGLRLLSGVDLTQIEQRYRVDVKNYYHEEIEKLLHGGLIELDGNRMALTERGLMLSNLVFVEFLPHLDKKST